MNATSHERNTADHLGIIELGTVCASMRARNLDLFERLGGWIVDTPDPELQRIFAEASHLHAWHAELWAQRAPAIPQVELDHSVTSAPASPVEVSDRARTYAEAIDQLLRDLTAVRARIDLSLDPSTARTVKLVTADLSDLASRLPT